MFSWISIGPKSKVQWNENSRMQPWDFNIPYSLEGKRIKILYLLKNEDVLDSSVE